MKKYFLIILIFVIYNMLIGFEPKRNDFSSDYQFRLYKSWLRKGNFGTQFPSKFSKKIITKEFQNESKKPVSVEYDWKNWKIYEQKEKLNISEHLRSKELKLYNDFTGSFIYRLNTDIKNFIIDLCDFSRISIEYRSLINEEALEKLITDHAQERFEVSGIDLFGENNKTGYEVISEKKRSFKIIFSDDIELLQLFLQLKQKESTAEIDFVKIEQPEIEKKNLIEIPEKPEIQQETSLEEYIRLNYEDRQTKELLHNKITNISRFLQHEFPKHDLFIDNDHFLLISSPFQNDLKNDISLQVSRTADGISITPNISYRISDKNLFIGTDEKLDLSNLAGNEIEIISPFLPQLIYEHRAIGTRLLNFLLIHDRVSTSLVVHGKDRSYYDIYSYANLLLMLHDFWQDRTIYFGVKDIKKVNGHIEFKGYLIAENENSENYDLAEIRYHLDNDYRIDLVMMSLYPETKKGR